MNKERKDCSRPEHILVNGKQYAVLYQTDQKLGVRVAWSALPSPDEKTIKKVVRIYIRAGYTLVARTEIEGSALREGYTTLTFYHVL
jgi:hypothetical protein